MGNHASCVTAGNNQETIELVCSDGTLQILHKPLTATQIIQEFPQYSVCHSDSFYIGHKTRALRANDQLKLGNKYFLLPQHIFQSPLSLVSLASLISPQPPPKAPPNNSKASLSSPLRSIERASLLCKPFDIQKSDAGGGLRIRVCPEFVRTLIIENRDSVRKDSAGDESRLCNTPELQKDYEQLVKSRGHRWKPTLESITEKDKNSGYKIFMKIKRSGEMNSS